MWRLPGGRGPFPKRAGVVSEYGSHRYPPLYMCTTGLGGDQGAWQRELQSNQHEREEPLQRTASFSDDSQTIMGPRRSGDPQDKCRATIR
jgi:hypothetical protein